MWTWLILILFLTGVICSCSSWYISWTEYRRAKRRRERIDQLRIQVTTWNFWVQEYPEGHAVREVAENMLKQATAELKQLDVQPKQHPRDNVPVPIILKPQSKNRGAENEVFRVLAEELDKGMKELRRSIRTETTRLIPRNNCPCLNCERIREGETHV